MKNFNLLGAIAFALLLSLNAGVFMEANNWHSSTELAYASNNNVESVATLDLMAAPTGKFGVRSICPPGSARWFGRTCFNGYGNCTEIFCSDPVAVVKIGPL